MVNIQAHYVGATLSRILISGHAGYAEHGMDIVCAGVSAIAQTAILGVNRFDPAAHTRICETCVRMEIGPVGNLEAQAVLETAYLGLEEIAKTYPQFVSLAKHI